MNENERKSRLLGALLFCTAGGLLACGPIHEGPRDAGAKDAGRSTGGGGGTSASGGGGGSSASGGGAESHVDAGSTTGAGGGTSGQSDAGQQNPKCKNALVCDDFEQAATGAAPGSPWSVALSNAPAGSITVDSTRAHSGTHAVKISVPEAPADKTYRSAMLGFASNLPVSGNALFGRMMFWLESSPSKDVHWTFIDGYGLVPGKNYHAFYRYGGQHPVTKDGSFAGNQLMANYETPDTYQTPPVGISSDCYLHANQKVVPTGKWACAEWSFDGSKNQMRFWLDGTELTDLAMNGTGQGCGAQAQDFVWTAPTFERIDIGWESYQADDPRTMWIDDVAIGTERLGCPQQ